MSTVKFWAISLYIEYIDNILTAWAHRKSKKYKMGCFVPLDLNWMKLLSPHCIYASTKNEGIISISKPSHSGNIVAKIKKIERCKMQRNNEQKNAHV